MSERGERAVQTVDKDWQPVGREMIAGVQSREIKNVVIRSGVLTELFRPEWFTPYEVRHAVHMALLPDAESSWHVHRRQTDIIVAVRGQLRIGLYDDRHNSPTYRKFNLVHASVMRPTLFYVPPGVWHAIRNATNEESAYVVFNDEPYNYEEPDDWTVPVGAEQIPHRLD
jgi:dTDP-4-dehydrorhamnose 3,5-epimerase